MNVLVLEPIRLCKMKTHDIITVEWNNNDLATGVEYKRKQRSLYSSIILFDDSIIIYKIYYFVEQTRFEY